VTPDVATTDGDRQFKHETDCSDRADENQGR